MARFLLAVWPFTGHVYPNLAVAHALCERGHEVAFYSGASARSSIEQAGFTYFPFDRLAYRIADLVGLEDQLDPAEPDAPELYEGLTQLYTPPPDTGAVARITLSKSMFRDWFLGTVPQQVLDLRSIIASWDADVLVCDPFMYGPSLILHDTEPIPVAIFSFFAGCMLPGRDAPAFASGLPRPRDWRTRALVQAVELGRSLLFAAVKRDANAIRRSYGLPPVSTSVLDFTKHVPLYLVASVPEYDYGRQDLPSNVCYVGPCLGDRLRREQAPVWLNQLSRDHPNVYVTEGTAHVGTPLLLRAAAQGLAGIEMHVVMTTGRHRDPADLDLQGVASNIRVERWVSHSDLFPKLDAVVTHGGSGTVLSALNAGLPLVVVPMQWDQAENAQRVVEAGAGVRLAPSRCTPGRVREAVEQVLGDPSFAENARRLASTFRRYGGPAQAAELLETLSGSVGAPRARSRQSVPTPMPASAPHIHQA